MPKPEFLPTKQRLLYRCKAKPFLSEEMGIAKHRLLSFKNMRDVWLGLSKRVKYKLYNLMVVGTHVSRVLSPILLTVKLEWWHLSYRIILENKWDRMYENNATNHIFSSKE